MKNFHLSKEHFFRQPRFESNISASQHLQKNSLRLFIDLRIVCIGRQQTEVVGLYFSGEKLWSELFNGERKVK